jgi:peptide/nickel transport system substrate-binding protein
MRKLDAMFDGLMNELAQSSLTRRQVLRRTAVLGLSVPAVSGLLAACGGDDDDDDGDSGAATATTGGATTPASGASASSPTTATTSSPAASDDATATTGASSSGAVDTGGNESISVRVNADLQTADPAFVGGPSDHALSLLIYNGLVRFDMGSLEIVPDLATDWEISEDGLTYTFQLREGVTFHKGYGDLTAEDVVFTFERIRDPEIGSNYIANLERMDTVEAIDPLTVAFTLTEPFIPFMNVLAFRPGWIVSPTAVEEKGENFGLDPIGTGPYMWDSRTAGTEVVLVKNPDYFEPLDIEEVHVRFVAEDSVVELALQSGDLDVAHVFQAESTQRLLNDDSDDVEAKQIPSYRTQWAGFNLKSEKMQDINVRKAIIHAIDKPAAAAGVAGDMAQPVSSIFNPLVEGYIDPDPFPYDPELAQQLLADAGYPDGIDIDVLVIPSSTWPDLAVIVQAQWAESGIRANLLTPERAVYDEMVPTGEGFDIVTVNLTLSDSFQYAERFLSQNVPSPNFHHYSNPEYDALVAEVVKEQDPARRIELWEQIQMTFLVEDVVGFGMTNVNYIIAWNSRIQGVDTIYQDSYYVPRFSIA